MATLKTYDKAEDFCLYLAFHPTDEVTFNSTQQRIDGLMKRLFGDGQRREYCNSTEKEIIYRVQKPIFLAKGELKEFFMNLQLVFNAADRHNPHFTQFESDDK